MADLFKYLQEKVVFLPTVLPQDHTFDFETHFEEYLWKTPFDGIINALHFQIDDPKGVILYFHGNSGSLLRWGKIAEQFTTFGYDVLIQDYRGYGKSRGLRNEEFLYSDAQFGYDFLNEKYGENQIVVYGRSLGGAFATRIAAENKPAKLILEATFYNLQDMASRWIPFSATEKISPKMTYHFLSNKFMKQVTCPVYHFHGTKDFVVPLKSGKKLFRVFDELNPQTEKKFIEIAGGNHDDLDEFEEFKYELSDILS